MLRNAYRQTRLRGGRDRWTVRKSVGVRDKESYETKGKKRTRRTIQPGEHSVQARVQVELDKMQQKYKQINKNCEKETTLKRS